MLSSNTSILETTIKKWDNAEKSFWQWLKSGKGLTANRDLKILKSVLAYFHETQSSHYEELCNRAFEQVDWLEFAESLTFPDEEFQPIAEEKIHFRLAEPSFFEENEITIKAILEGDQKNFNEFYEMEFPAIVRHILQNNGTIENAKDIFHEGIIILIEQVYRGNLNLSCSLGTYLFSICKNLWYAHLRKNRKYVFLVQINEELMGSSDISIKSEDYPGKYEKVKEAISNLSEKCRKLLELYYYKNKSWEEIAMILGYKNAAAARQQKYKCLERIRTFILK